MIGKVLLHVGKNQSKSKTLTNKFGLLQIQLRGLGAQPQGNFVTYTSFMLRNSIFSTWTGTKLLWKCGNLIINWVTLSSTNYIVPERLSSQSDKKYEIKKTSKISILQLFRELEKKIGNTT